MISVITSCHNSNPEYLRESINSILGQTYQDFEFLIADNGVWFNLKEFLSEFNDPRIKYIYNGGNIGPTASYDKLADMAKGEYVAIQDHDDISLPDRLEVEKQALDNEPEIMSVRQDTHFRQIRKRRRASHGTRTSKGRITVLATDKATDFYETERILQTVQIQRKLYDL